MASEAIGDLLIGAAVHVETQDTSLEIRERLGESSANEVALPCGDDDLGGIADLFRGQNIGEQALAVILGARAPAASET